MRVGVAVLGGATAVVMAVPVAVAGVLTAAGAVAGVRRRELRIVSGPTTTLG
jgi:hypothetical protein